MPGFIVHMPLSALCSHNWLEISDPFMSPEILWHSFSTTDQSKTHHKTPLCSVQMFKMLNVIIDQKNPTIFFSSHSIWIENSEACIVFAHSGAVLSWDDIGGVTDRVTWGHISMRKAGITGE